jgi:hypothetical protein
MHSNNDKHLESEISRELKALPPLTAPASLVNRVMAAIEQRANVPWYQRSWQTWPRSLQAAALVTLLVLFGGLCFAGWELSHAETMSKTSHRIGHWFSGLYTIGNVFKILADSTALVVKKMGTPFAVACLAAAGLGYAVFLSLGTIYFRLAFPKR